MFDGCIVESLGFVDRNGIHLAHIGDLPLACAATCSASVNVQRMGMEAAVHGDVTLLKQAMLHDPLVGAVCNPEEVWQMTDEMLHHVMEESRLERVRIQQEAEGSRELPMVHSR